MPTGIRYTQGGGTLSAGVQKFGYTTGKTATTQEFQKSILTYTPASWASGGNLNQARNSLMGAGASNSSGVAFGGTHPPGVFDALSEEYDGTSWTEGNNINNSRKNGGGCGTQTSALCTGGQDPDNSYYAINESYDGTSWTEVGDLNTGRHAIRNAGTASAAIAANG